MCIHCIEVISFLTAGDMKFLPSTGYIANIENIEIYLLISFQDQLTSLFFCIIIISVYYIHSYICIPLSVTEITQLAILFTPGSERRLKKSSYSAKFKTQLVQLNNFSSAHPIVLSIEDRVDVHCWLKPPHKCTQTTLIC